MFRQSEATGSGIAVGINSVAQGQGNQAGLVTSQWVILGGQELLIVGIVAIHIIEDVGGLVFVLGVASQVT